MNLIIKLDELLRKQKAVGWNKQIIVATSSEKWNFLFIVHTSLLCHSVFTKTSGEYWPLINQCEVRMGKYLPEVCAVKTKGKYFPVQTRTNEINKEFIIWLLVLFFSLLTKLCVRELTA